jgi:ketosteroid isomerase-like protein
VSSQKATVQRYTDGFRSGDLAQMVSCLTDDVVWALHGAKTLTGRDAFAAEADAAGGPTPQLHLDRLIEEGDTVAVVGHGSVDMGTGDPMDFVYSEVFTFSSSHPPGRCAPAPGDALVSRLDTFHIWLGEMPAA